MSNANGIGISKTERRNQSNITAENGHKVTDKAHSIKEMQNLRTVTRQYINFVKENYSGKVANNINAETARAFIEQKAENVSGNTLNTYISTMYKLSDNLNKDSIGNLNREDIQAIKQEIKDNYSLKAEHINRAYENIENIRAEMQHTPFSISAELQLEAGLRAADALDSSKWQINHEDKTITVEGSKGGLTYTTTPLRDDILQKAQEAKESGYRANYEEYRSALKEAVENSKESWNGTHGLRYTFAQNRVEELKQNGYTDVEARARTSLELGHSRLEITNHYLH